MRNGLSVETVYTREIIYAEAADKRTRIHFPSGEETYRHSFSEMERILSAYPSFFRIHRSYIVALDKIRSVDRNDCIYIGDEIIRVTDAFKDTFNQFLQSRFPGC